MPLTCRTCRRANPAEAVYCHFDGVPLEGHPRPADAGPPGSRPFPMPFIMPSGRRCSNFNELALAWHDDWSAALDMLRGGLLENFLSGLGRLDLVGAAREAARFPDPDRGLDQFLGRLPGDSLTSAKLLLDVAEIDLGTLAVGCERRFTLTLRNGGQRLLSGSVAVEDTPWLAVGEAPHSLEKGVQVRDRCTVPVHVLGQRLRAGAKPLEGRLVIDTNGGKVTLPVRAAVHVRPFPTGLLQGAVTPRQVAEKAKAAPKEAAVLFENGSVQRWYQDNGWAYPVQGPAGSGLGAVQQFFEALGLVRPPKVTVAETSLQLRGRPGEPLGHSLRVFTEEKRPVFASAVSDQPWLTAGRARLDGRTATIPLSVRAVPDRPGETLTAHLTVTANGNQRFVVPLTLVVGPSNVPVEVLPLDEVLAVPEPVRPHSEPVLTLAEAVAVEEPQRPAAPGPSPAAGPAVPKRRGLLPHLAPLGVLSLIFLGLIVRDLFVPAEEPLAPDPSEPPPVVEIDPKPQIAVLFHDGLRGDDGDKILPRATMRFGLVMLGDGGDRQDPKKLTYDRWGRTNNTCLKVDDRDLLFGDDRQGRWVEKDTRNWKDEEGVRHEGRKSVWSASRSSVRVTQTVEIVPGEVTQDLKGRLVRYRDTCLVRYRLENDDAERHEVGLRFMLDTFIGANDGVPFTIPGEAGLCDTSKDFDEARAVPGYIQAQEFDDLAHPGTVAHVQFRLGGPIEAPERVTLGAWPDKVLGLWLKDKRLAGEFAGWDVPVLPIRKIAVESRRRGVNPLLPADSAVVIYWEPRGLGPGAKREVGFAYGLGKVSAPKEGGGNFLLTGDAGVVEGQTFTVQAVVSQPRPGQTLTLTLPAGLELAGGSAAQKVPPVAADAARPSSTVTWQVRALREGVYRLTVQSDTGSTQRHPVRVGRKSGIFGSN